MTEHGLQIVFLHAVQLLSYGYCDGILWIVWMHDDEWIGNRHVGIGWGCKVVRGRKM